MGKKLVIVESPAKAKTINKFLGSSYIVKSSVGHIRDLPTGRRKSGRSAARSTKKVPTEPGKIPHQLIERMGINPYQEWSAKYEILPGKEKVVKELQKAAKNADEVFLATDLDREGEAIAWHLQEVMGGESERFKRVVFNEITKSAIQKAFETPTRVDHNQVNAQQTRRFLDRLVGFMVSPLLWSKIARGLSAGRVQSVAVRLIVDREREIRAFIPEEYWEIHAQLANAEKESVRFKVTRHRNKALKISDEATVQSALSELKPEEYRVDQREDKPTRTRPNPPFITSTLQQAASTRLGFGVKKTMGLAQKLYEAGYITYMRTDSFNVSQDALGQCRQYIESELGEKYLPKKPNFYARKAGAQEAHEAIRPSDVTLLAERLPATVDRDGRRLYELIWRQFVACQMVPAEYLSTSITVKAGDYELRTKGRIQLFDGFTLIQPSTSKKDEFTPLPDLSPGELLMLNELIPSQHFTQPSPRYSEATLVRELEKRKIGRPSTYAAIISTIQERGYVRLDNKRFYAEKIGEIVTDRLVENFTDLLNFDFTAKMEEQLDQIALGEENWLTVLDAFFDDLNNRLTQAADAETGMRANKPTDTGIPCPDCKEGTMQIRTGGTGVFLGCSRYSLPPKERCKHTINLIPAHDIVSADEDKIEVNELRARHRCPICDTAMEPYLIDSKTKLHVCGNNPDCPGIEIEKGTFKLKGLEGPEIECDKCGGQMELRSGRFGKYYACTSSECKNTRKVLRSGEVAPPKMTPIPMPHLRCDKTDDHFVLRDGAAGLFLAASQYPRHRETRAPKLTEILSVADQLDPKYAFLLTGPTHDPDGNPTLTRYSRKTREVYLGSEKKGRYTSWAAYYKDGKWKS